MRPGTSTRPLCAGIRPIIVLRSVLLPEPLSPTTAKISPAPICALMALCTGLLPVANGEMLDRDHVQTLSAFAQTANTASRAMMPMIELTTAEVVAAPTPAALRGARRP